ncbi:MAG: hypothetical protein R3E79_51030 [Caldilineaceae bacterium]
MKAIMVMFDSLNRHRLPPYGYDWTHAPNFARLAERTACFTKEMPLLKINSSTAVDAHSFGTLLFDLASDPQQEHSLQDAALEARMIGLLVAAMQANDAPPEQYIRLGLEAYVSK